MTNRPISVVLVIGVQAALAASLIPAVAFLLLGERIGVSSWSDLAATTLPTSAVILAVVLLAQAWLWFRGHLGRATAEARAHRAADELTEGPTGRVHPATPDREERAHLLDDLRAADPNPSQPPRIVRWWFGLEGWQQVSLVGGLAGIVAALVLRAAVDSDGFQSGDLFGMAWVWSIVLWFSLTIWASGYALRAHPGLHRLSARDGRNPTAGLVGSLFALELFPRSVWFLVTSLLRFVAWPLRALLRP